MQRKYQWRYVTSLPVEYSVYRDVKDLLPKGITITDEINEFLIQRLADLQKDAKRNTSEKSPIKILKNTGSVTSTVLEKKQDLDIYWSAKEMIEYVNKIQDLSTMWKITRQAKLLSSLTETRAKNLRIKTERGDK